MRTACFSGPIRGLETLFSFTETPLTNNSTFDRDPFHRDPLSQIPSLSQRLRFTEPPLHRDTLHRYPLPFHRGPLDRDLSPGETLWKEHGTRYRDPLEGTWDQSTRQEVSSYREPPLDRQTPVKILPCPSFKDGKKPQKTQNVKLWSTYKLLQNQLARTTLFPIPFPMVIVFTHLHLMGPDPLLESVLNRSLRSAQ